ncbi:MULTISPECIES: acetate/propionate family kinase [unclassified Mucilaginibacter]|uniref:acetate/propionate family kinase n=1 Tax=unclassified Mucilaginibacter TaxID=2617802 RepID=UPI002AC9445B|nr:MULTISPECIES: acetate/propionate family kinase [unclassified Mucilaginibacter]MEB0261147.1 acetate/propionate family kinase [Mucilaginibacter sp. 10I4]MEB0280523.1 acetate/propionate family kinase [Mucilaginibacter sp. 10B2]MEB0303168.1 acetate/propionate family kinase [Mucilaginibacter sp. 5C4]WPX22497.1 acetate/propionate family kinase [Mucilaginibacter sp. 5C4]
MMRSNKGTVLTINGGSSSIKFALYTADIALKLLLSGAVENIGTKNAKLNFINAATGEQHTVPIKTSNYQDVVQDFMDWLGKQDVFNSLKAIGHRVVHGMSHTKPEKITIQLLDKLKEISAYDPEHLPEEIKLIEQFNKHYPSSVQVACFDTAFHAAMPLVAKLLPIPRPFSKIGIRRYGFHGLSYSYLMEELEKLAGSATTKSRVILAHLGSGASLAAVKNGKSIDTSMGFTPTSGIPMSTRTGDLDPGVAAYLIQHEKLSPHQFNHLVNHESGLLGISETSADMQELLQSRHTDHRAAEAIDFFCYQTKKYIGAYAAALGGLDTLVFSGGIGEHAPEVREMICKDLQFLGIDLDKKKNTKNEAIISKVTSKVAVRVIPTNEELMIARLVCRVIKQDIKR